MSVSNTVTGVIYSGNGSQTAFSIPFDFKAPTHVKVILVNATTGVEAPLAYTTDFSVSGTTLNMVVAPTASQEIVVYRESPRTQTTEYLTTGPFLPADHEEGLDKIILQVQELQKTADRCIKVSLAGLAGGFVPELVPPILGEAVLVIDSLGQNIEYRDPSSFIGPEGPQGDPGPTGATGSAGTPGLLTALAAIGSTPNANGMTIDGGGVLNLEPADGTFGGIVTAIAQSFAGVKTFLGNLIIGGYLHRSVQSGITAFAGGGQASATQLTKDINRVTTVATAADSVKLPAGVAGMAITVINDGASSMNVYPATGEAIDALGTNAAYALSTSAKNATFICVAAGVWKSQAGGAGGSVSPLTTKGDLYGYTTLDARVAVGSNGQVLEADSTAAPGVAWKTKDVNTITSSLTLTGGANLSPSATKMLQTFLVQGNAAAVTLATTPFGGTPPPDGAEIYLIGNSDTNTVEVPVNDAANGCLMDGSVILAKGQTAKFMYSSTLARYVRL